MNRETVEADVCAAVVVAHGGKSVSTERVTPLQLAVLRMVPLAYTIRQALHGEGVVVYQPRYQVRGWNDELASPVHDLEMVLDQIGAEFGGIPVVLIGHSMGARAAFRVAGHPAVSAVAGLAPWLPAGEPVDQLAGRRVLLAHGTDDHTTDPADTWAYTARARSVTTVAAIQIRGGEHTLLRRAPLWHHIAADFSRLSLGLPTDEGQVMEAFREAAPGQYRTVV
jgi:pimeloyl-ACP methyl ester carboxylesterase